VLKNRKLAKHIANASRNSFFYKLDYKAEEQGNHVIKIEQCYASSKTCFATVIKWKKCYYQFASGVVPTAELWI